METWVSLGTEVKVAAIAAILASLLGALLSLLSSLTVFALASKQERKAKANDLLVKRDVNARVGLSKLVQMTNQVHSIEKHISKQLSDVQKEVHISEPALAVVPIVSGRLEVDEISATELEFLFFSKSETLLHDIQLFQQSVSTLFATVREYNRQRREMDEFSFEHGKITESPDGQQVSSEFPEKEGRILEVKVGMLNRLLADLIEFSDRLKAEGTDLLEQYTTHAETVFGDKFPKVNAKEHA